MSAVLGVTGPIFALIGLRWLVTLVGAVAMLAMTLGAFFTIGGLLWLPGLVLA